MSPRLAVALLSAATLASACRKPEPVEFKPPDEAWSVRMPVKPSMKPSHSGTMYIAVVGDVTYNVGVTSVPDMFKAPGTEEKMFDEMQKSLIGTERAPAQSRAVTLPHGADTFLGREVVIEKKNANGVFVVTGRAFRVRNTIYTQTAYTPAKDAGSTDVRTFFDSFKLLKLPGA